MNARALVVLLALAAASCKRRDEAKPAPETTARKKNDAAVVIVFRPPPIGTRWTEEQHVELSMTVTSGSVHSELERSDVTKKSEEVLGVDGLRVTKLRVTYEEKSERTKSTATSAPVVTKGAVVGRTYLVEIVSGTIVVKDEHGGAVPSPEAAVVAADHRGLTDVDPFADAFPKHALQVGESVPRLATAIHDKLAAARGPGFPAEYDVQAKLLRYEKDGALAVFDLGVTLRATVKPIEASVPLEGTLSVRTAEGWPVDVVLEGPMRMNTGTLDARGALKIRFSRRYA